MTNVNFMSYPMACAYSNGVTKEQAELKNFMKDINTNIAINQAEVKCKFL